MITEINNPSPKHYKTPLKKLSVFFESSRDKWKKRSSDKQKYIDELEVKVRDLTKSRNNWKEKYKIIKKDSKKKSSVR
jgi:hypothetical protein